MALSNMLSARRTVKSRMPSWRVRSLRDGCSAKDVYYFHNFRYFQASSLLRLFFRDSRQLCHEFAASRA